METVIVELGKSLHRQCAEIAERKGVSLERWMLDTLRRKIDGRPMTDNVEIQATVRRLCEAARQTACTGTKVITLANL